MVVELSSVRQVSEFFFPDVPLQPSAWALGYN